MSVPVSEPGPSSSELAQHPEVPTPALRTALRFYEWVIRAFSNPRAPRWVAAFALLATSPALFSGLGADDHIHRLSLRGTVAIDGFQRAPFDLFRFASPEWNARLMDQGIFPWWADPEARLAFFRPITSLTHWLDYRVWPNSAFFAHAQSLLWFLLLIAGVWATYKRLVAPPWAAVLALFFYALDDARAGPIAWIANRNALIAGGFSIWTIVLHHRARSEGHRASVWLAPLALAVGLLAAEGAIAIVAYLLSYAMFLDRAKPARRILSLLPYALVVIAWRIAAWALGYGSFGSGVYVDPLLEPRLFLSAMLERFPILMLGQLAAPWSELYNASSLVFPPLAPLLLAFAFVVLGATALLLVPIWRRDCTVRFWAVGTVIAALPSIATFPADRLLTWIAIGAFALMARLFAALVEALRRPASALYPQRVAYFAAFAITLLHLVIGPALLPWRSTGIVTVREMLMRADGSLPKDAGVSARTFVYINPPADPFACYIPIMRADLGEPRPKAQRWLATGATNVTLERLDERSLRVRPDGGFLPSPAEKMLRSPSRPLLVGQEVRLSGTTVKVTERLADGRPAEAIVTFDRVLEDPALSWFQWSHDRYAPFKLPAIGVRVVLPKVNFFEVAYGA